MTVIACHPLSSYHSNGYAKQLYVSQKSLCHGLRSTSLTYSNAFRETASSQRCTKLTDLRKTVDFGNYSCTEHYMSRKDGVCNSVKIPLKDSAIFPCLDVRIVHSDDLKQLFTKSATFLNLSDSKSQKECRARLDNGLNFCTDLGIELGFLLNFGQMKMLHADSAIGEKFQSKFEKGVLLTTGFTRNALHKEFAIGIIFRTEFGAWGIFRIYTLLYYVILFFTEIYYRLKVLNKFCARVMFYTKVCTRVMFSTDVCTRKNVPSDICTRINTPAEFCTRVVFPSGQGSFTYRTVGRRKQGEQKSGKQKKNGEKYGRKNGSGRSRRTSQGNGSSGMEGSGEGSGNRDDSSDDDDDDDEDDDEEQDDEDDEEEEEEEGDDEEEMDTDNVSAMAEDDVEDTTNGGTEEADTNGGKVTSTTLEIHTTGIKDDVGNEDEQNTMTIAPAEPGTPVTLSGVIWKETMGGVLVVNLKWRNKTYSGSLIDHSRYGWANPRNLEENQDCDLSTSSRGSKGKKGKHKESAYTGNPLSPKMAGNGKRGSRFHRNKGKHKKESSTKSKTKRGSDTAEEGTRTRRRSCTVKTSVSPSPSPTPFIECPERNCNKRYKHINGLRYHQKHGRHNDAGDGDDKDSFDEDDMKFCDLKEPLSANSKSSGSDDVKPLSHRKAKNQKSNSKTGDVSLPDESSIQNGEKIAEAEEVEGKYDVTDIKTEEKYDVTNIKNEEKYDVTNMKTEEKYDVTNMKTEEKYDVTDMNTDDVIKVEPECEPMKVEESTVNTSKPNILEEAVKIIFDEPTATQDLIVAPGIFSRMTSHAMLAASHPPEYKYVGYEPMQQSVSEYGEKTETIGEEQELEVTVKEEVIDEGHAGVAKISCKDESEETIKLENAEMRFNGTKSSELAAEETPRIAEDEKSKLVSSEKAGKSRKGDGASVAKEQIKTSAAEIRSLPGYTHFRLPPNNSNPGFLSQAKSLTLDTGLLDSKDPQKGGIPKEAPRQERAGEKAEGNSMVWKIQGAASASSASFQLTCESKTRPGYLTSSRKPSVVTANTTWFPAVSNKISTGGVLPGQEVLPEKPGPPREVAEKIPRAHEPEEEQEEERTKLDKGEDERSKGSYSSKPARAVGVAHPFNAEKSEGEFALGMIGSITTDPVRVLYSKSSSPKMSVDHAHPDMSEIKKVRVEKTLEVPVGEVVPLAKTSRSAASNSGARGSVMLGSDTRGNFSGARVSVAEDRLPQIITTSPPPRDTQQSYTPSSTERSSPWRPPSSHSPSRELEPRSRSDPGQPFSSTETYMSRKPARRSPVPDHRSPPFRGSYLTADIGRRTPETDYPHRGMDKRVPFRNIDERLAQKDSNKLMDVSRNSSSKDIPGGLYPSRSDSPRKDTPGTFHHRLTADYRDPERGSPFNETMSRRQYDKSPIRDRRSPSHARRSPEVVERPSFRDTSPKPLRDTARHSPYRERIVKQSGESEVTSQRKDSRSPIGESRMVEVSRGYHMKPEGLTTKEAGDNVGSQHTENKFPRITEEEVMMINARNAALYQAATAVSSHDPAATREAMENYMMYLSRMSLAPGFDPRLMQAYPAMFAAQMPLLFQSAKESTVSKDERPKEMPEDIRKKTNNPKPESLRSRAETGEVEVLASKRQAERTSSSREKAEYESMPVKKSKTSDMKSGIIDDREGGRMQLKTLEQRAMQQQLQHRMDALSQLQTENLKMKAEERFVRSKPSASSSSSRLKPSTQESRTITKREDKSFSKEEKSPANVTSQPGSSNEGTRARNPESKSPVPSTPTGTYLGFMPPTNLPANHALSNNYEQAMHAMQQGYPPLFMASPFSHLPPGIMMANPALVPGSQLHSAARGLDPKRDPARSSASSSDRVRPRDEDGQENESRSESRDFSSKKEMSSTPRINPPGSPPLDKAKEKSRGDYDEAKQRRDTSSLHGSQTLPANLAYRRADMSGGLIDPATQFAMMYPGHHGSFRPPYDHPFMSHPRK